MMGHLCMLHITLDSMIAPRGPVSHKTTISRAAGQYSVFAGQINTVGFELPTELVREIFDEF